MIRHAVHSAAENQGRGSSKLSWLRNDTMCHWPDTILWSKSIVRWQAALYCSHAHALVARIKARAAECHFAPISGHTRGSESCAQVRSLLGTSVT